MLQIADFSMHAPPSRSKLSSQRFRPNSAPRERKLFSKGALHTMLSQLRGPPWHFHLSFLANSSVQEAQEQRKAKMARYTPASAPYEELQAARAQRLEVRP